MIIMKNFYFKVIGVWFLLAVLANINGLIRNFVYGPYLSELTAHQISAVLFIIILLIVSYLFFGKKEYSNKELWLVGSLWLVLTIAFEFLFGHFVIGHSWGKLLADYNLLVGRLWSLVLLITFLAPWMTKKIFNYL